MKPFNLERALAGDKVVTRDGREVVQLFYADKVIDDNDKVVAVVDGLVETYTPDGFYYSTKKECIFDLFMATTTVKVERWVNMYKDGTQTTHQSKEYADVMKSDDRIACVHLTGEYEA